MHEGSFQPRNTMQIKTNVPKQIYQPMDQSKTHVKYLSKSPLIRTPKQHQKRQAINNRFKSPMIIKPPLAESVIPGPADLSGTNILDIPIIFADNDGSLLSSETLTQSNPINPIVVASKPNLVNKVVLINKPAFEVNQTIQKVKPQIISTISQPQLLTLQTNRSQTITTTPMKYTKIILAKRPPLNVPTTTIIQGPSTSTVASINQLTLQSNTFAKISDIPFESIDVEQEIKASTLTKPVQAAATASPQSINKPELTPGNQIIQLSEEMDVD